MLVPRAWERTDIDIKHARVGLRTKRPPVASPIEHTRTWRTMCRDITTLGIYMYTIGTNVCPVVDRLVDCASNREITLRYRESCYNYPHRPPPPSTSLCRDFISCSNSYRSLAIIHYHNDVPCLEKSRSCSIAGVFFVDENCESSKFSHFTFTSFPFILESEISELPVFLYYIAFFISNR